MSKSVEDVLVESGSTYIVEILRICSFLILQEVTRHRGVTQMRLGRGRRLAHHDEPGDEKRRQE